MKKIFIFITNQHKPKHKTMKQIKNIIWLVLLFLPFGLMSQTNDILGRANAMYNQGMYLEAYDLYIQALKNGDKIPAEKIDRIIEYAGKSQKELHGKVMPMLKFVKSHNNNMVSTAIRKEMERQDIQYGDNPDRYLQFVRYIDLSGTGITEIPETIKKLPMLDSISIGNNPYLDTNKAKAYLNKLYPKIKIKIAYDFKNVKPLKPIDKKAIAKYNTQLNTAMEKVTAPGSQALVKKSMEEYKQNNFDKALKYAYEAATKDIAASEYASILARTIKQRLKNCSNLQYNLELEEQNIRESIFRKAANIDFKHNISYSKIKTLNFDGWGLSWLPYSYISKCQNLEKIIITGNHISDYNRFYQSISGLKQLSDIYISAYDGKINVSKEIEDKITGIKFEGKKIDQLPQRLYSFKNLKVLDISDNNITVLDKNFENFFENLNNLRILNASKNNIEKIEFDFNNFNSLVHLDLSKNKLTSLPASISNAKTLEYIDLSFNNFDNIPKELFSLPLLRVLLISHNQIHAIPSDIGKLSGLENFDIGYNKVENLPPELFTLYQLDSLNLKFNAIKSLSEDIGNLKNLLFLDISVNSIDKLPVNLYTLKKLQVLDISWNMLDTLTDEIIKLRNLKILKASGNQIRTLPENIGRLNHLQGLYVNNNKIEQLPESLYSLMSLKIMDISWNNISEISGKIGELENLIVLYTNHNNLTSIPPEIGNVKTLRILFADGNKLKTLPYQIQGCEVLTVLSLNNNMITHLPDSLGNVDLLIFQISNNKLTHLPAYFSNIRTLITLDMSYNKFTSFPVEILNNKNMMLLDLSNNNIKSVPSSIDRLERLITLKISNNQIETLPSTIKNLKDLESIYIDGNRLSAEEISRIKKLLPGVKIVTQ